MGVQGDVDISRVLQQYRVEIVEAIDTERQFIRCYLQSKLVLDDDDCERISSGTTRRDRAAKLLDILSLKGPEASTHFIDALEFDNPTLYEKITGKKADARRAKSPSEPYKNIWDWTTGIDGKALVDFDRQFLANQLDRAVMDLKNMTYWHKKIVEEKNMLERKLYEATDSLETKEKCMEDMKEEILHLISDRQAVETERSSIVSHTPMHDYLQDLWKECFEKSRVIVVLQGKVMLANEQVESLKKNISELTAKNDDFKDQIRELTIINNYERTNSLKVTRSANEQTDELKREVCKLKFKCNITREENESLQQELDSFQKWTEVLNARFDALKEEKTVLQGNSDNMSNRFQSMHKFIGELEDKQKWQNFKMERSEHEVSRLNATLSAVKADRERMFQSLQEVRLARDEAEKENCQLRLNLATYREKYELETAQQRSELNEVLEKQEKVLEEIKLMEERAFHAEKRLKSMEEAAEKTDKQENGCVNSQIEIKIDSTPSQEPDAALPQTQQAEEDRPTETESPTEVHKGYFREHKRTRDSLIDSIRRKLMPDEEEVEMKVATLPWSYKTGAKKDVDLSIGDIISQYPTLLGTRTTFSFPFEYGTGCGKRKGKDAPCSKPMMKTLQVPDDNSLQVINDKPRNFQSTLKPSKSMEPIRPRCFCVDTNGPQRIRKRRSQSMPMEFQISPSSRCANMPEVKDSNSPLSTV